jgi:hypothetical protein
LLPKPELLKAVKDKYPYARIATYIRQKEKVYRVFTYEEGHLYFAEASTESQAWENAREAIFG